MVWSKLHWKDNRPFDSWGLVWINLSKNKIKMRKLLFFSTFILSLGLTAQSNPYSKTLSFYGKKISAENTIDYNEFVKNSLVASKSKIKGLVLSSCPKKGCWMEVKVELDTILVRFKDYGFFVPKSGLEKKETIIEGYPKQDTISVKMLKHYAEDAGKTKEEIDKITSPKYKISFIADGVIIRD